MSGTSTTHVHDLFAQLREFKSKLGEDLSCIVFVKRRYSALTLSALINSFFGDDIRSMHLVGHDIRLKLRVCGELRANDGHATALDRFSKGFYHVIVATSVAEEGLDIRSCLLVIRFNPMETLNSYIQSL